MNAKDHFIEWLREKILQNPAEPPATAWQKISDSLDLEDSWSEIEEELELDGVWQKVDSRLHYHEHLLRFEKISQGLSLAALLLLFLPVFYMPAQQKPTSGLLSREHRSVEKEKAPVLPSDEDSELFENGRTEEENAADASSFNPGFPAGKETGKVIDSIGPQEQNQYTTGPQDTKQQAGNRQVKAVSSPAFGLHPGAGTAVHYPEDEQDAFLELPATVPAIVPEWDGSVADLNVPIEMVRQPAATKSFDAYPSSYIGAGTAVKVSSLLNSKTWYAMERTSLLRSSPGWQQDIYVLYGQRLAQRLFLQADVYLQNKAGQQYQEYREGTYTRFRDELSYHSAALSLSWIRKQLSYGKIPVYIRWTGGLYGGRLRSAEESSRFGAFSMTDEYSRFHVGLLAGYEYDLVIHPQLMLSYGLFGRADIMNIYAGTEHIPSSFRKTRATSMDLRLTLRYTLKK